MFAATYDPGAIAGDAFDLSIHTSFTPPADGDVLTWDNTNGRWDAITPPVTGDMFAATYDPGAIAGDAFDLSNHISFTPPADGDVLTWDNTNGRWDAITPVSPLNSGNGVTINASNIDLGGTLSSAATVTTGAGSIDLNIDGAGSLNVSALSTFTSNASFSSIDVTGGAIAGATLTQTDNVFTLRDDGDGSKQATFELSGIAAVTTRNYILPDQNGTIALIADITPSPWTGSPDISYSGGNVGIGTATPGVILDINSTDAIKIPVGNDAQRPGTPVNGMIRYSNEPGAEGFEGYIQGAWGPLVLNDFFIDPNGNNLGGNSVASPTGSNNIVLGLNAGPSITTGSDNIIIGSNADNTIATTGGNVAIGNTADATGGDAIALGTGSQADGLNSVAIGTNSFASDPNTIVLGGTGVNAVSVGIGTASPRVPLQIGGELGIGYFQNATEVINGDAIMSNLYPDYSNATDNQLRRSNADSASFIFFDDGEILFMNVVNGAVDSQLDLSNAGTDVRSWMELRNNGNIDVSEGIVLGAPDPGDERPGMIRWDAGDFEGNTDGTPGGWVSLTGGGLTLPYNSGPQSIASTLFSLTQQDAANGTGIF